MWILLQKEDRIPDGVNLVVKAAGEESCYQFCHSTVEGDSLRDGVAIALREADQAALLTRVPISPIFQLLA